jgi:AAA domain/TrwC relaxase
MLSLSTGYDTGYLTDAVGGSDYYTGAAGEPPGYWQGKGAAALGLEGQVDPEVMKRLYHEDVGPDGQVLSRRQRPGKYPEASGSLHDRVEAAVAARIEAAHGIITPEEIREIRLRERAKFRTVVPFYDFTLSVPKTVSVLWASLLAASAEAAAASSEARRSGNEAAAERFQADAERFEADARQIEAAVKRANDRMIADIEAQGAYVRTGHHSATSGEWRDAGGFIVASFHQHTNREGDPQLHIHNAIANRAQRADGVDEKWRALHGDPLFKDRLGYAALGDMYLEQEIRRGAGWVTVQRPDGNSFEIKGISEDAADAFSFRSREVADRYRELEAEYKAAHGHAPGKRAWWALRQRAALETRDAKEHDPPEPGDEVAGWARKAEARGAGKLAAVHEAGVKREQGRDEAAAASREASAGLERNEPLSDAERARVIRVAVAEVQRHNATWNRAKLAWELRRALGSLRPDVDPKEYLDGLVAEAVGGRAEGVAVLQVGPAPELVPNVERLGTRDDGVSVYRPPGQEKFATAEHRDREQWLVDVARLPVVQRVRPEVATEAIAGTDLDYSQREAVLGLLISRRLVNSLQAPAGTGKTTTVAAFARVWEQQRVGRVIGLTASTNAARVMADEAERAGARMETFNIAQFLGKIKDSDKTRGHVPVYPGDVLVVDEATQVSTDDAARIVQVARQSSAMVVATFDPEQLGAVDAGGIFPLIAARHGSYELQEVRRFRNAWERDASLRLRRGDVSVLTEYNDRGRIYHGPQDRVFDDAVMLYLNGHLRGQESLLMATSNETAAKLAGLVRERLIDLHRVGAEAEVQLADGNQAGRGDLMRARLNTRIDADGQTLANRDTIRLEGMAGAGDRRVAVVRRETGPGQWSKPFLVPAAYLQESAELAYAGNVHVAQGRTVERAQLVVDSSATRSLVYTGATRGREKNTLHVVTGPPDPAQPDWAERRAYAREKSREAAELREAGRADEAAKVDTRMPDRPSDRQMAPWEAVLAQALQQDEPERTALEEIQAAQDFATHTGHLLELVEAFWQLDVVPKIDEMVRQRVTPREYERYRTDPERPAFLQELRAHEIGGRRIEDVLDSITAQPMDGLRSIAAGLHGRLGKADPPPKGETGTWAQRAPRDATPDIDAGVEMLDERQAELGGQVAAMAPEWAVRAWGRPPAEPGALQGDWQQRAGLVQSYREAAGITDPGQAIGPVPAGKAHLAEAFHASVRALELPDEAAMLRAMSRGQLEARVVEYERAEALAPRDVAAEVGDREHQAEEARVRAETAVEAGDVAARVQAEADAEAHAGDLADLRVADAARREWREATAGQETAAREAAAELARRGRAEERTPVTDAEVDEAQARQDTTPIDSAEWAQWKARQAADLEAAQRAREEAAARACPVTDAEIAKYGRDLEVIEPQSHIDWFLQYRDNHPELFGQQPREPGPESEAESAGVETDAWKALERDAQAAERALEAEKAAAAAEGKPWPPENPRLEQVRRELAERREAEQRDLAARIPATDAEVEAARQADPEPRPAPEADAEVEPEVAAEAEQPQAEAEADEWAAFERDAQAVERALEAERAEAEAEDRTWPPENPRLAEVRRELAEHREAEAREAEADEPAISAGEPDAERAQAEADLAEIDAGLDRIDAALTRRAEREAERRAELDYSAMRQAEARAEAEATAEAAWQPGTEAAQDEAAADFEAELEI